MIETSFFENHFLVGTKVLQISLLLKGGGGSRTQKLSLLFLSLLLKGGGGNMRLGQCPSIWTFFLEGIPTLKFFSFWASQNSWVFPFFHQFSMCLDFLKKKKYTNDSSSHPLKCPKKIFKKSKKQKIGVKREEI